MKLFSQRDRAWAGHAYGYGPGHGTIGEYGCLLADFAMILNDSGFPITPPKLDELVSSKKLYMGEGGGLFDLLPSNLLDRLHPGRYRTASFDGFQAAMIKAAVPSKDTYAIVWISTTKVKTHFMIAYSADCSLVADPWTGAVSRIANYGGTAAIHRTILVKALPAPKPPAQPAPTPPVVTPPPEPPPPVSVPKPEPPPEDVSLPSVLQELLILLLRLLFKISGRSQP